MPVGQAATSQTSSPALIIHQPSFFLPQRYLVLSIVVVLAPNMGPIGPGGNHLRKKAPASPLVLYSRVEIVPTGVLHIKLEWLVEYSKLHAAPKLCKFPPARALSYSENGGGILGPLLPMPKI